MLKRIISLTKKEFRQFLRDKANLMIGLGLPLVLILLFGYALSLDVKNAKLAVVMNDRSPKVYDLVGTLQLSPYFTINIIDDMTSALDLMKLRHVDGIIQIQNDFSANLSEGKGEIQLLLHAIEASRASVIRGYVLSAVSVWQRKIVEKAGNKHKQARVEVVPRVWFNPVNNSTWYLVPGLIVLIMTLIGALLTALVMAREWERGTLEALFVSPVRPVEILIAKMIPYFCVGMGGFILCVLTSLFLFHVPIEGSLILLSIASMFYMFVALGIGLLISAVTKNQFVASQIALLASFLPALMLSGFIFDLRNVPLAIQIVGKIIPATYFCQLIKTLFLAGNNWKFFFYDCFIMFLFAVVILGISWFVTRKKLD